MNYAVGDLVKAVPPGNWGSYRHKEGVIVSIYSKTGTPAGMPIDVKFPDGNVMHTIPDHLEKVQDGLERILEKL